MRRCLSAIALCVALVATVHAQLPTLSKPQLVLDADGHSDVIRRVLFTPLGKAVITVSNDKTVRLWDVSTGETNKIIRLPTGPGDEGSLSAAAVTPDGRALAVSGIPPGRGKNGIIIYVVSLQTGMLLKTFKGHENLVTSLAYNKAGTYLASSSADRTVNLWDVRTGRAVVTLKGSTDAVRQVVWSPDGKQLASVSTDGNGKIWTAATGKADATITGAGKAKLLSIAWSPDGKTIATGNADASVSLWEPNGKARKTIGGLRNNQIISIAFTPDSKEVLCTGAMTTGGKPDFVASLVDLAAGKERVACNLHNNTVFHGAVSPDGKLAATTGGDNNETILWNTSDASVVHTLVGKGQTASSVAWSPDGKSIGWLWNEKDKTVGKSFVVDELEFGAEPGKDWPGSLPGLDDWKMERTTDGRLVVLQGKKLIHPLDLGVKDRIYSYTWMKDGRGVVGGVNQMYLVDPKANRVIRKYVGHTSHIFSVAPSPDGKFILSAAADQTIRIWDPDKEEPLLSFFFAGEQWVAWTAEGYFAASANGDEFLGWQVNRGAEGTPLYHPASRFRGSLLLPDMIKKVMSSGSVNKALLAVGKKPGDTGNIQSLLPPQVTINTPTAPTGGGPITVAENTKVEVKASAKSVNNYGVTSMRLLVDGRPYKGQAGLQRFTPPKVGAPAEAAWTVELTPGTHTIAVQATTQTSKGLSSFLELNNGGKEAGPPTLYVLAIGVSDYAGSLKLRYAASDAELITKTLKEKSGKLFGKIDAKIVTNKQATKKEMMAQLQALGEKMTPRDTALVFFSGHGHRDTAGNQFLVPVDVNPNALNQTCISGEYLKNALGDLPGRVIAVMDSCFSGGAAQGTKKRAQFEELVRDLVSDDYGVIVLCSSSSDEVSFENTAVKAGFFTTALVEGLTGKGDINGDGQIYLNELEGYAARRTRELSRGQQNPIFAKPPNMQWFPLATTK
jgi:WD40 repeat protein